mmetsp:Transcript_5833/g.6482  ORF Transcript_5833/g.6482 Transcript_5833/m.6482 type:complete len:103 (-) Transcript_5833:3-311(-)
MSTWSSEKVRSIHAWKWTTGCLTSWMFFNPQILAPNWCWKKLVMVEKTNQYFHFPISRNKSNTTRGLIFVCFLPNVNSQQPFNTSNLDSTLSSQPKNSDILH